MEKDMKIKKLGMIVAAMSISLLLPAMASADNFKIVNSTSNELSFGINHTCSSEFGSIPAHSNKTIPEANFYAACKQSPHNCVAKVYVDDNCSGKHVATVVFDTDGGLKEVLKTGGYAYTWNRYNMMITERV
jgi:hypothetical protein